MLSKLMRIISAIHVVHHLNLYLVVGLARVEGIPGTASHDFLKDNRIHMIMSKPLPIICNVM
jgi:hypothetical protein